MADHAAGLSHIIRRGDGLILATDGMSDPFDDQPDGGNGFGMELFLETSDIAPEHAGSPGDITKLSGSWAFAVLSNIAGLVAGAGGVTAKLDQHGVLSVEVPGADQHDPVKQQVPARYIASDGSLGVLIGGPLPDFATEIPDMPLSPVRMVPVVVIDAVELDSVRQGGKAGRDALVQRLAASPTGHRSSLTRPSFT